MNLPKTSKFNSKGHLEIGGIDTLELAKKFGTPLFVLDEETLRSNCRQYINAFAVYANNKIIYANKALCAAGVLRMISSEGLGMDVASGGEIFTALKAGAAPESIYFHGNSKTTNEITYGIRSKINFVADNSDEIKEIIEQSKKLKTKVSVLLRVNPGIEAHTHDFIKTGIIDSKFGIQKQDVLDAIEIILNSKLLVYKGLHGHIGSQIFDERPYVAEVEVLLGLFSEIKKRFGVESMELNLGGGIGIAYTERDRAPDVRSFASKIIKIVKERSQQLDLIPPKIILEPGRSIVGPAVVTLYTVGTVKDIPGIRKYVVVDGGMSDNPRPILYGAMYEAVVANKAKAKLTERVTIAGRACESGDVLIRDIQLPKVEKNDLIAVACTGAYNYSMASNYNRFTRPALVSVNKGKAKLLIKRETYEDLVRNDL